ncbi:MAG: ATP-dependent Clp protease adaptor ClpS [Bacteroidota bacterium]
MIKELTQTVTTTTTTDTYSIILYNDEVNTFDWVIKSLMDICEHSSTQAEQCAWIVHFRGKYVVKQGGRKEMINMCVALGDRGLTAEVE